MVEVAGGAAERGRETGDENQGELVTKAKRRLERFGSHELFVCCVCLHLTEDCVCLLYLDGHDQIIIPDTCTFALILLYIRSRDLIFSYWNKRAVY